MPCTARRLLLSYLYVPGHRPDRIERAYRSNADAVVLDLEDGVPEECKDRARSVIAEVLSAPTSKPTFVRINGMATGRSTDDLTAVAGPGLHSVRIPKVRGVADVKHVADMLASVAPNARVHVLVESAAALEVALDLARARPSVAMLGIGESDLRTDLGCALDGATMDACRIRIVSASRAAGLPNPAQSVYPEVRNHGELRKSCEHGKQLGFFGRMAIHPDQIDIIHDVYTPDAVEIADSVAICEAADGAGQGVAVTVSDRRLVAPPIVAHARQVLKLARELGLTVSAP